LGSSTLVSGKVSQRTVGSSTKPVY